MTSCRTFSVSHLAKQAHDIVAGTACKAHGRAWRVKPGDVNFSVWADAHVQASAYARCGAGCSKDVRVTL